MPRSPGITTSAVITIIGSVFSALCGGVLLLDFAVISKPGPASNLPLNFSIAFVIEALVFFGFASWGIAAGIGLIELKGWARISTLLFAGFLVLISTPTALLLALIPIPAVNSPKLPSNFAVLLRIGLVAFYGVFAALGIFWLYFFNKGSVKAQFQTGQGTPVPQAQGPTIEATTPSSATRLRPLSITIIGWFLLISAAFTPLALLFNRTVFPGLQMPLFFLGFFLFGRIATSMLIVWAAVQAVAAVGLLKLKNWARLTAIALQCLVLLNFLLLFGIGTNRVRFQQFVKTMAATLNARTPYPSSLTTPAWVGLATSFPIILLILWFLVKTRHAFDSPRSP